MEALGTSLKDRATAVWRKIHAKKPHFNFITAHYMWIVGATLAASVLIYGPGQGHIAYIDSLVFAAGANTQAGLNPVDINKLNTFQQTVIYVFAATSNPITLHGFVVILRLYWFEKRFQGWVRDARARRGTLSKSKSQARDYPGRTEQGVNGRTISVIPRIGRSLRMANDGVLLEKENELEANNSGQSDETDSVTNSRNVSAPGADHTAPTTDVSTRNEMPAPRISSEEAVEDEPDEFPFPAAGVADSGLTTVPEHDRLSVTSPTHEQHTIGHHRAGSHTAISFAPTVKRSDGMQDDDTKFPQERTHAEHIAILERQRDEDNEVLRIPGPRDAERGQVPRRLDDDDAREDDETGTLARTATYDSRPNNRDSRIIRERQPTITITEPERRRRDDLAEDAKVIGSTFDSLRLRKPRIMNRKQHQVHEDDTAEEDTLQESSHRYRLRPIETIRSALSRDKTTEDMPYLSYTPTIGRNSNFIGLSLEQREELGGIEYRSLRTLALVLIFYFCGFSIFGITCLLPFILHSKKYGAIVADNSVQKTWWGFFTSNSAFTDLGFTLTSDSMNSFHDSAFVLMIMWFLILVGNTGFPVMLRFVIWILAKIVPTGTGLWEELRFLLDHPRRCFTLLFPSAANWWLFWILVVLNAVDLLFFIVLDLGNGVVSTYPVHIRVVDGLFQAASTRTAGFSCVSVTELHPAVTVLYIIMMYISVFPIAISIRRTNVYEEKSLGVYGRKDDDDDGEADATALSYVGTHLRRQLSFDLWYVFLGFFVLAISEGPKIQRGEFGMFEVLFEIVSAYGTVGLSFGRPGGSESLCAAFTTVGKLVIVAMMIRGRHRGLPYGLDRAVLLPSESRFEREAQDMSGTLAPVTTGTSGAATSGFQRTRSNSIGRGRSRSRERPRTNSNLVTQFLHPGPVVSRDTIRHRRARSADSDGLSLSLRPDRTRTNTLKYNDDDEGFATLAPLPSLTSPASRRTTNSATLREHDAL